MSARFSSDRQHAAASAIGGFSALVRVPLRWPLQWLVLALALLPALGLGGCAVLPPATPNPPSAVIADGAQTSLGRLAALGAPAQAGVSGFRLLPEASFAFDARIALIRHAEKSLDVQYYLIKDDDVGLHLLHELRDAAARGVRVRLLVDDLYTAGQDELFATLAAHPNVEVRLFNPFPSRAATPNRRLMLSFHEFGRVNHRMHNKLMVADDSLAVSGGRNIANEYFMRSTSANFIDVDVLSSGPVVHELSLAFDRYWNSAQVRSIQDIAPLALPADQARARFEALVSVAAPDVPLRERDALDRPAVSTQIAAGVLDRFWGAGQVFADDPAKIARPAADAYRGSVTERTLAVLNTARSDVTIVSPYFIPGPSGMTMIERAMKAGGQITVITNSLGATDEPLVYAGYERHRSALLKAGVTIYEIAPDIPGRSSHYGGFGHSTSRLHAKLAVIDGRRLFLGSMNLDHRSAVINTEIGLVIDSEAMVRDYARLVGGNRSDLGYRLRLAEDGEQVLWIETGADGAEIVHRDIPGGLLWLRLKNWLLLPIIGENEL